MLQDPIAREKVEAMTEFATLSCVGILPIDLLVPSLTSISIYYVYSYDGFEILSSLPRLKKLLIHGGGKFDVSKLASNFKLECLSLENKSGEFPGLENLKKLPICKLQLNGSLSTWMNIPSLAGWEKLEELFLESNVVDDKLYESVLTYLPKLCKLSIGCVEKREFRWFKGKTRKNL